MKHLPGVVAFVVIQLGLVNGCVWALANCYDALPLPLLNGLVFVLLTPIVGAALILIGARALVSAETMARYGLLTALPLDAVTLWIAMGAADAVGVYEYQQLRARPVYSDAAVDEAPLLTQAGYVRFRDARVAWGSDGRTQRDSRGADESAADRILHDVVFLVSDASSSGAAVAAWLCFSASHPETEPPLETLTSALAAFRQRVETVGVVGGFVLHDPYDRRDCELAIDNAALRGVPVTPTKPLILRFAPSRSTRLAGLRARVQLYVIAINVIWVLAPLVLLLRALWRRRASLESSP